MDRYADVNATDGRIASTVRWLGRIGWAVLTVGLVAHQLAQAMSSRADQTVLVGSLGLFFLILLARLAVAAWLYRDRRRSLVLLLIAVLLWAAGSVAVNASSLADLTRFPAPGEGMFLASYAGMVAYLILDVTRKFSRTLTTWLDVAVICGGTACLASLLLLTPVAVASGQRGLPLLLALLYPMADLALALLVLAQWVLRARTELRSTVMLGAAFLMLACADSAFALGVSSATYQFSNFSDALWGTSFAILVASACRPKGHVLRAVPRIQGPAMMVVAGITAVVVLTVHPTGALGPYAVVPAVITLLAASARMTLALRQANTAAEAVKLSQTDDLTMLPNRRAVRQRLDAAVAATEPLALMLLDLDGFKEVNDTLGHAAGDTVLQLAALRMRDALPDDMIVARLGGDEFAIVVSCRDEIALMETAQSVLAELIRPVLVDGIEIAPSASIGIAVSLDTDTVGSDIMRRADVAMYQAKITRRGTALYDAHADEFSRSRLQLAEELRKGLVNGQVELWYQPQIDAATQHLCGLEALVRWQHPTQGLLTPIAFLPAARRAGLMGMLSDTVARLAVRDLNGWLAAGLDVRVAINCAPPELLSQVFLPRLYASLDEWMVPADRLVLEVTEDSFLAEPERARAILLEMREHGLQVAIDDYGTGFSSLAYLRDLPVQELKIDRSFVNNIGADLRSRMIVASTIQMAHALDMRIVAEGVEDAETAAQLVDLGADVLQGYHFARPIPAAQVEQWVRDWAMTAELMSDAANPDTERDERERGRRARDAARTTRIMGSHRSMRPLIPEQ